MLARSTCFSVLKLLEPWESTVVACAKRRIHVSLWKIHGKAKESTRFTPRIKVFPLIYFRREKLAGSRRPDSKLFSTTQPFVPLSYISSDVTSSATDSLVHKDVAPRLFSHSKARHRLFLTILGLLFSFSPIMSSIVDKNEVKTGFEIDIEKADSSGKMMEGGEPIDVMTDLAGVNQKDSSANQVSFSVGSVTQEQELENHQPFSKDLCTLEESDGLSESQFEQETHNPTSLGGNGMECTNYQTMDTERTECFETDVCTDNESLGLDTLFEEKLECSLDDAQRTMQSKANFKQRKQGKKERKRQLKMLSEDTNTDVADACVNKDDEVLPQGKKKPKKIVPNYFLAIRVHNPQIHAGIKIVQDSIATHKEKLKPAFVSLATLHVTLMVMHLEDAEEIQKAEQILHQCKTTLEPILNKSALTLTFSGLDHFGHQVLYVKLEKEGKEVLKSVEKILRETFTREGIPSTDSREYNPHMTVMKLTGHNPKLRREGIKKIPAESYASWVDMSFGEEPVKALHLCSMSKKDKDGFYKCMATVTFDDSTNETSSSEAGTEHENIINDMKVKSNEHQV